MYHHSPKDHCARVTPNPGPYREGVPAITLPPSHYPKPKPKPTPTPNPNQVERGTRGRHRAFDLCFIDAQHSYAGECSKLAPGADLSTCLPRARGACCACLRRPSVPLARAFGPDTSHPAKCRQLHSGPPSTKRAIHVTWLSPPGTAASRRTTRSSRRTAARRCSTTYRLGLTLTLTLALAPTLAQTLTRALTNVPRHTG